MWRKVGSLVRRRDGDRPKTVQAGDHASSACPVSLIQRAYRRKCALYAPVTREFKDGLSPGRKPRRQKFERGRAQGRGSVKSESEVRENFVTRTDSWPGTSERTPEGGSE